MTYEDGLREGLRIARDEQRRWLKKATKHAESYWGGWNSDYAQRDLKLANIAKTIGDNIQTKIEGLQNDHSN